MPETFALDHYRILGPSGLRVSPMSLGTWTFMDGNFGCEEDEARRILDTYLERGGNFIDTANSYSKSESEGFLGRALDGRRDRVVLATKYTINMDPADANSGGNHRGAIRRNLDASLKRLNTDYVDLYWLHGWDFRTPVEEVVRALDDAVRSGKVLSYGLSNTPAWKVAEADALARAHNMTRPSAVQVEYSLVERSIEYDTVPMADNLGMSVVPWSPLGGGFLTGKYAPEDLDPEKIDPATMARQKMIAGRGDLTRKFEIVSALRSVAEELDATPSQVALRWMLQMRGRPLPIIGASKLSQLEDNLGALEIALSDEQMATLNDASAIQPASPQRMLDNPHFQAFVDGGIKIEGGFGG